MDGCSIELKSVVIIFYQVIGKCWKTLVGLQFSINVGVEEESFVRVPFEYGFEML